MGRNDELRTGKEKGEKREERMMKGDGWRASVPWVWSISDERGVYSYDSYLFSADLIPSRDKIVIMKD
jgi:hypothetical protein